MLNLPETYYCKVIITSRIYKLRSTNRTTQQFLEQQYYISLVIRVRYDSVDKLYICGILRLCFATFVTEISVVFSCDSLCNLYLFNCSCKFPTFLRFIKTNVVYYPGPCYSTFNRFRTVCEKFPMQCLLSICISAHLIKR